MQTIGHIANQLVAQSTGSASRSNGLSNAPVRPPEPTNMDECRALAAWAETLPIEVPQPASDNFILNRIGFMQATLPAKSVDEAAGEKRATVYLAVLRGISREALTYMADQACRTLEWFPTPKVCLDILAGYRAPESERAATLRLCGEFAENAFETWLGNVRARQPIGDVPEQWCRIAVERGVMRRLADGSFVSRALYHGPAKPWAPEPRLATPPLTAPMREAA